MATVTDSTLQQDGKLRENMHLNTSPTLITAMTLWSPAIQKTSAVNSYLAAVIAITLYSSLKSRLLVDNLFRPSEIALASIWNRKRFPEARSGCKTYPAEKRRFVESSGEISGSKKITDRGAL